MLTTHVLDTARGRPAGGLRIDLAVIGPDGSAPRRAQSPLPRGIACQMRAGRSGMLRCPTPTRRSASTTALTIAGVEPIVAASPMPLAPIGLWGVGVTVWSVVNEGRSSARGTA